LLCGLGIVDYRVEGFCEKNKDSLEVNIAGVCQHSKSHFVAALVPIDQGKTTLGVQFKAQLTTLMNTLKATSPHFIRCIKSNMLKVADTFDGMLVLRQLRYLGLKDVVSIRQLGYPVRKPHTTFFKRYKVLAPEADPGKNAQPAAYAAACQKLLAKLNLPPLEWRVGLTKTFTKSSTAS
jgi:myosin-7